MLVELVNVWCKYSIQVALSPRRHDNKQPVHNNREAAKWRKVGLVIRVKGPKKDLELNRIESLK